MSAPKPESLETDPRFPSGPWIGYYLQGRQRSRMEMRLTFGKGVMTGEGRDVIGRFSFRGRYSVEDGTCHWIKHYHGQHDVFYRGYDEGKGIWGVWEITMGAFSARGGFHIWPEGMAVDDAEVLAAEADLDDVVENTLDTTEPLLVPIR